MRLTPPQIATLLTSMGASLDMFEMTALLQTRFGLNFGNLTSLYKNFRHQSVDIHTHFDQHNMAEALVAALRDARPLEPGFIALSDAMGFTSLPGQGLQVFTGLTRSVEGDAFIDPADYRLLLARAEDTVCRVETAFGKGTGALIAESLVLTNHHVVAKSLDPGGGLMSPVTCLFGYRQSSGSYATPPQRVTVQAVLASSPPATEDMVSNLVALDPGRLDYAILRLDKKMGSLPMVDGMARAEPRGFLQVNPAPAAPVVHDAVTILQHPLGRPMMLDLGAITWAGGIRVRHNVSTTQGSSGSPVLDRRVRLVALHHAGYDWPSATHPYNQAIPLSLIVADALAKNVLL